LASGLAGPAAKDGKAPPAPKDRKGGAFASSRAAEPKAKARPAQPKVRTHCPLIIPRCTNANPLHIASYCSKPSLHFVGFPSRNRSAP
jgi:hypothetical protein